MKHLILSCGWNTWRWLSCCPQPMIWLLLLHVKTIEDGIEKENCSWSELSDTSYAVLPWELLISAAWWVTPMCAEHFASQPKDFHQLLGGFSAKVCGAAWVNNVSVLFCQLRSSSGWMAFLLNSPYVWDSSFKLQAELFASGAQGEWLVPYKRIEHYRNLQNCCIGSHSWL